MSKLDESCYDLEAERKSHVAFSVEELRQCARDANDGESDHLLMMAAADEIERLRMYISEACSYREAVDMLRAHREAAVLFDVGEEFLRGYDHAITTLACRLPEVK